MINDFTSLKPYRFRKSISIVTLPTAGMYIDALAILIRNLVSTPLSWRTHLIANVFVKVLVRSNVHTNTAILEPFRLDLVRRTRHSRNNNVRNRKTLLQRQRTWVCDVTPIILSFGLCRFSYDAWALRVFLGTEFVRSIKHLACTNLDRFDIYGQHAGSVISQESCQRSTHDLRSNDFP